MVPHGGQAWTPRLAGTNTKLISAELKVCTIKHNLAEFDDAILIKNQKLGVLSDRH